MATTKVLLKTNQPKKDGTIPVLIRVVSNRKQKFISTGYAVKPNQFKEGLENWIIKHPDAALMNSAIEAKRTAIMEAIYKADIAGSSLDLDSVGHVKKMRGTFYAAIMNRMDVLEKRNQVAMYNRLRAKLACIKEAWGKEVLISAITPALVQKYISYRLKKENKVSTIKKDLRDFSSVLASLPDYTGKDYFKLATKNLKAEEVKREKLTLEEIVSIESIPLEGVNDVARDMFLFSFYCHGMRLQNVALFERGMIKKGMIQYRMNKGRKIREILIHKKLQALIDKYWKSGGPYLFPMIKEAVQDNWDKKKKVDAAGSLCNIRLARIAVIAGIEKHIHFHIARHTFAYLSLERGVSYEILKDALGHSDYATTQAYLKSLSDRKINDAVIGLYD